MLPIECVPTSALGLGGSLSTRLFCLALILASSSAIRRQMLFAAGVEFDVIASAVDEEALKTAGSDAAGLTAEGKFGVRRVINLFFETPYTRQIG